MPPTCLTLPHPFYPSASIPAVSYSRSCQPQPWPAGCPCSTPCTPPSWCACPGTASSCALGWGHTGKQAQSHDANQMLCLLQLGNCVSVHDRLLVDSCSTHKDRQPCRLGITHSEQWIMRWGLTSCSESHALPVHCLTTQPSARATAKPPLPALPSPVLPCPVMPAPDLHSLGAAACLPASVPALPPASPVPVVQQQVALGSSNRQVHAIL